MKSFPFIVCLVVGVWVGYYVGTKQSIDLPVTKSDPVAPGKVSVEPEMVKHESIQLMEDENKILKQQLADLREELNVYLQQDDQKLVKLENAKQKFIKQSLAKYRGLFDLTPEQEERIAELEWKNSMYWKQTRSGKMDMKENPPFDKNAEIRSLLTSEQAEIFDIHLSEQRDHTAELMATANLGKYPVTLILSGSQKDALFANLYTYNHPDTRGELSQRRKEDGSTEYSRADQMLWAAEGVLDEEQQAALRQSFRKEE